MTPAQRSSARRHVTFLNYAAINRVHFQSNDHTWETPGELFRLLDAEFRFTLDVCALPSTAKCNRSFSPEDDGLAQPCDGVCWMNPPYGRAIIDSMRKAFEESRRECTVVCLVRARTETEWWHEFATRGKIRHLRGRVRFGATISSAPFPSAVVIFRDRWWEQRHSSVRKSSR